MRRGPRNSVRIREIPNESKRADPRKSGSRLSRILSCKLRLRSGDRGSRVLLSSLQRPKVTLADVSCVQELARQLLLPHLQLQHSCVFSYKYSSVRVGGLPLLITVNDYPQHDSIRRIRIVIEQIRTNCIAIQIRIFNFHWVIHFFKHCRTRYSRKKAS